MRMLFAVFFLFTTASCSLQKMAIRSAAPMFADSTQKMTLEKNWEFFRDSTPANLKFLEMIYLQDPTNETLLSTLIKGYAGYAFAVPETLAFGDELAGLEVSQNKQNAIMLYTKALDYGIAYFEMKGIKRADLLNTDAEKVLKQLDDELDEDDLTAVLFTAQAWGSLINLQKDNVALVSHVPSVKNLFDWVCKQDPKIENGVCPIFYAQYEASRPRMLGGNPEKAKELYRAAIQKYPKHLLIWLGFIQYSILPAFDNENYAKIEPALIEEFAEFENSNRDTLEDKSKYKKVEHLNLYNAIAKKRFEFVLKNKKKIFEG